VRSLEWSFCYGGVGCRRGVGGKTGWKEDGLKGRRVEGKTGWREDGLEGRRALGGWFGDWDGKGLGRDWFLMFWVGGGSGLGGEEILFGRMGLGGVWMCNKGEDWSCDYVGWF